jgi:hypothetical protein
MTAGEFVRMEQTQIDSMCDWFTSGSLTEASGSSGALGYSYSSGSPIMGSVVEPTSMWQLMPDKTIEKSDSLLRVAHTVTLGIRDKVTITSRNGVADNSIYYVSGEARVFRTDLVYPLSRVIPGMD